MEASSETSEEKLEQMLSEGSITREEYQRLSEAIRRTRPPLVPDETGSTETRKLRKNSEKGVIGGLCAGLAEYYHADVLLVRSVFVAAFFLLTILTGAGLALIPLYLVLCTLIPWDDEEKAHAFRQSGHLRLFLLAVASLLFLLPALYSVALVPWIESACKSRGIKVWSPLFQDTLPGRAFDCASEYRGYLHPGNGVLWLGCIIALVVTLFLGTIYAILCKQRVRRNYTLTTLALGLLWLLFLVAGTLYPLVSR